MPEKSYKASTGVDEFYYALLDGTNTTITTAPPELIDFIQTITVNMPQEVVRGYGSNKTAELAVSNGNIAVTGAFHKLPLEDRIKLLGLETDTNGLAAVGSEDNPPYVACVFAKTHEDGSKEWVGLPKGIFTRPNTGAETKRDGVTFRSDEISAQFMDRAIAGFKKEKSVIFGKDADEVTAARDALFQAVFGQNHPDYVAPVA